MATNRVKGIALAPIIFLDIDGVLLPFQSNGQSSCGSIFPDRILESFSSVLEAVPEVKIVLSSTWRAQKSMIQEILDSFRCYGLAFGGPLAELTEFHDIVDPDFHSERQYEILGYLKENRDKIGAWIALDDEELVEGESNAANRSIFEGHAVLTKSYNGLSSADAETAIQLLRAQLGK